MLLWGFLITALLAISSAFNIPGIPTDFTQDDAVLSAISDDIAQRFTDEYFAYRKTGIESATLRQITKQLASMHSKKDILTTSIGELSAADQFFTCTTCRATVNVLIRMFRDEDGELNGANSEEDTKQAMLYVCATLKVATEEVCLGLFDINWPVGEFIVHNSVADSRSICGTLPISFCSVKQDKFNFVLDIDQTGAVANGPKTVVPKKTDNDLNILHITDIHYDPDYVAGGLAECDEPLCCRRKPASGEVPSDKQAGYWSDYRECDSPLYMIEDAFDHMKKTHEKIDYIYHTGDIIPHNMWETSKESNKKRITEIDELIAKKFPGIPVYSSVGNHEAHPSDVFSPVDAPAEININWLYEHLYSLWSKWLPDDTKATILKGGYYTVSPKPGFRIISLNNNDCYMLNWWVYHDGSIATEQLVWLHDTLLAAEKAGEHVHILVHIPYGDSDCWTVWARECNRIVKRYRNTISAHFNGHTHVDEMNVHYTEEGHAVGISWNGGSLTTYTYKNPNYRVYQVEPETLQVVDHETWIFDVNAANAIGAEKSPVWFKEYQFSEAFTTDLSPAGIDALLVQMAENPELLRKYWRYKMKSAEPKLSHGCNNKCLLATICRLATTTYNQKTRCHELQAILEKHLNDDVTTTESPVLTTPEDDGAASLTALTATTLIGLIFLIRSIF